MLLWWCRAGSIIVQGIYFYAVFFQEFIFGAASFTNIFFAENF